MKLSDLKLDSAEWQKGKGDRFRLTEIENIPINDWNSNWRYSFKYEGGEWFQITLDNVGKLIEIIK
tara:strand:+ start:7041 stop:7238 length:198 start_codon:yes stop_codon:yes gene_type:complete